MSVSFKFQKMYKVINTLFTQWDSADIRFRAPLGESTGEFVHSINLTICLYTSCLAEVSMSLQVTISIYRQHNFKHFRANAYCSNIIEQ